LILVAETKDERIRDLEQEIETQTAELQEPHPEPERRAEKVYEAYDDKHVPRDSDNYYTRDTMDTNPARKTSEIREGSASRHALHEAEETPAWEQREQAIKKTGHDIPYGRRTRTGEEVSEITSKTSLATEPRSYSHGSYPGEPMNTSSARKTTMAPRSGMTSAMGHDPFHATPEPPEHMQGRLSGKPQATHNPTLAGQPSRAGGALGMVRSLVDAPRRVKEGAEEFGARVQGIYHEAREKPATRAAIAEYTRKMSENNVKRQENERAFRAGQINAAEFKAKDALFQNREKIYMRERDAMTAPIEQRVARGTVAAGRTFATGAVAVQEKFQKEYRPMMRPTFKAGKGTRATRPTPKARGGKKGAPTSPMSQFDLFGGIDYSGPMFSKKKPKR
jgi:hypothetical protein